jgi:DNA-binding NarL/FixJ family response regulator
VAEAGDGVEAVGAALRAKVDLAVLDVSMPRLTGLQAAAELSRRRPAMRRLMLSMHDSEQYLYEARKAGASGCVLESGADRDLVEACRAAMRGEPFLCPAAVARLIGDPLTPRELQDVKLIAEAHTTDQIAELLTISPRTVERRREKIPRQARHARPGRAHPLRDQARARRALMEAALTRMGSTTHGTS